MAYTTEAELVKRFGEAEIIQLSDKSSLGVIDSDVVTAAISDADNEMNAYLGVIYELPLSVSPAIPMLEDISSDIARFRLHENRATQEVVYRYEKRIEFLQKVAAGKAILVDENGNRVDPSPSGGNSIGPRYTAGDQYFTDDTLANY